MYLWDTNIVRHFGQGHPTLRVHLLRVPWKEIALPSVAAEVLLGRCDFALVDADSIPDCSSRRILRYSLGAIAAKARKEETLRRPDDRSNG